MKPVWFKVVALVLALTWCGAGSAPAVNAAPAGKGFNISQALLDSYDLIEAHKYSQARRLLDQVLAKDPGNPLALNNLAAVRASQKKFDQAEALLNQALAKAKGYQVLPNLVCRPGSVCMAFRPVTGATGNVDLETQIKMNLEMLNTLKGAEAPAGNK
jgi:tetratricopeptide (TPR) repeat protein